jgi:hypothetical protein
MTSGAQTRAGHFVRLVGASMAFFWAPGRSRPGMSLGEVAS